MGCVGNLTRAHSQQQCQKQSDSPDLTDCFIVTLSIQQKCRIKNLERMHEELESVLDSFKPLNIEPYITPLSGLNNARYCSPIKSTKDHNIHQDYMKARCYFNAQITGH